MREKPIIFNTEMVRAILDGRKTMTRRVIKPQPTYIEQSGRWVWAIPKSKVHKGCCTEVFTASREWWEYLLPDQLPYQPGDILWARETWADLRGMGFGSNPETGKAWNFSYKADIKPGSDSDRARLDYGVKWRPSIHMPRAAARIFLKVTNVRVERLQDITEEDAIKEGFVSDVKLVDIEGQPDYLGLYAWERFNKYWDSIYKKRGYGWETNYWVWVIEFERVEVPVR